MIFRVVRINVLGCFFVWCSLLLAHCFVHEVVYNNNDFTNFLTVLYMLQMKTTKGLALQDILTEVHAYIHRGTHTHACTHTRVYIYMHMHTYAHTGVLTHTQVCMFVALMFSFLC